MLCCVPAQQCSCGCATYISAFWTQANSDADEVDIFLIVTLLQYICGEGAYQREEEGGFMLGAVLVFLPGAHPLPHALFSRFTALITAHLLLTRCSLTAHSLLTMLTLLISHRSLYSSPTARLLPTRCSPTAHACLTLLPSLTAHLLPTHCSLTLPAHLCDCIRPSHILLTEWLCAEVCSIILAPASCSSSSLHCKRSSPKTVSWGPDMRLTRGVGVTCRVG